MSGDHEGDGMSVDTTNFDDMDRVPIDRVAWRVIRPGVHWDPARRSGLHENWGSSPLPVQRLHWSALANQAVHPGDRAGRVTVIGYGGKAGGTKSARWVCRCDCGAWGYLRTPALTGPHAHEQMCSDCNGNYCFGTNS